ncbi:MAG TPA: hypothetical protein VK826_04610 [Bacteroidia bacterium]|nr:hypothetical protein [Bacteroidia bacterium]
MEQKSCFIIMPFSKMVHGSKELGKDDVDYIYQHVIKKAVEEYCIDGKAVFKDVRRFDSNFGSIIDGIVGNLNDADIVIADLTGKNPNVMYELGVRHALKRGTVVITQNKDELPSDLRDYMCIEYVFSDTTTQQPKFYEAFKTALHETLDKILTGNRADSPVLNYLNGKGKFWREDEVKRLKQLIIVTEYINDQFNLLSGVINSIEALSENRDFVIQKWHGYLEAHFSNLQGALQDVNIPFENIGLYEVLQAAKATMVDVNKRTAFPAIMTGMDALFGEKDRAALENMKIKIFEARIINHFKLLTADYETISIREVFSEDGDFADEFIGGLQEYIEKKTEEFGLKESDIDQLLNLESEESIENPD